MHITQNGIDEIEQLYRLLQEKLSGGAACKACGKCCDFESFGHRLYLTTPEWLYFKTKLAENNVALMPMTTGVCPYRKDGKCSVYPWRFAGCRIFNCTGEAELQSQLSEESISQMKSLCETYSLPYRYVDLKTALNTPEIFD
jgi:Fe-S-cluster containining protein